jgi:hypothetical protein
MYIYFRKDSQLLELINNSVILALFYFYVFITWQASLCSLQTQFIHHKTMEILSVAKCMYNTPVVIGVPEATIDDEFRQD